MIFATVGTQLPFDRLLNGLDAWAGTNAGLPVLAQSGETSSRFQNIRTVRNLPQSEFLASFKAARLIVAHAGMGTILSAAEMGKPVILMPRLARFREHRNDHQVDTAAEMSKLSNVTVVNDADELHAALDRAVARNFEIDGPMDSSAVNELEPLIGAVRDFVWGNRKTAKLAPSRPLSLWGKAA